VPQANNSKKSNGPNGTVKYSLTTKDLLRQAEAVAASQKLSIPASTIRVVEPCIKARIHCNSWFKKTYVQNEYSNGGHSRFLEVLQEVLDILKPCVKSEPSHCTYYPTLYTIIPDETVAKKKSTASNSNMITLQNKFESLEVEDAKEAASFFNSIPTTVVTPKKTQSKTNEVMETYELFVSLQIEMTFDVFYFFEDLHNIQDFLKDTWKCYKARELT
jgi:hypothetical protein